MCYRDNSHSCCKIMKCLHPLPLLSMNTHDFCNTMRLLTFPQFSRILFLIIIKVFISFNSHLFSTDHIWVTLPCSSFNCSGNHRLNLTTNLRNYLFCACLWLLEFYFFNHNIQGSMICTEPAKRHSNEPCLCKCLSEWPAFLSLSLSLRDFSIPDEFAFVISWSGRWIKAT